MRIYRSTAKSGTRVTLYSDDTFTLALGNPSTTSEESTPGMLAECFSLKVLQGLKARNGMDFNDREKLSKAIGLATEA